MNSFRGHPLPAIALLAVLLLAYVCLRPGLTGGFLFDDAPNLQDLSAYGGVTDWGTFRAFVFGGWSGPTGRPIALASFLLNDNAWPSEAAPFKYTNLMLHLLAGALLAWAALQLCRFYGLDERRAHWTALFGSAAWLLHPFLVSTTLYPVQRMTQLAAIFVFAALVAYLHGRRLFPLRPRAGLVWMGASLALGTVLATLSKENGALLPLLVLVVEFCAPATLPRLPLAFRALFLWLPSFALLGYLLRQLDFTPGLWPDRPFDQPERLLTESRILWDYLGNLFLPRIEGSGLYRDDIVISHSLFDPPSTAWALAALAVLLGAAFWLRRRAPFLSLAVLFFFAGHLIESTWLGLELYFEHRNYLPSAFLFLPLARGLDLLRRQVSAATVAVLGLAMLGTLAFLTYQRASLWGDAEKLEIYWALAAPNSPRAQNALANFYARMGDAEQAEAVITDAIARLPDSPLLTMSRLLQKVYLGTVTPEDFTWAGERLVRQPFDAQAVTALRTLVDQALRQDRPAWYRSATLTLIDRLAENPAFNRFPLFLRLIPYLKARLLLADGHADEAEALYREAMRRYANIDSSMQMVAEVGNAGYYAHAARLLDEAETLYRQQPETSLKFPRRIYDREIARIRAQIQEELSHAQP
jgi:tetratricopeptide (TPR) repeat protein